MASKNDDIEIKVKVDTSDVEKGMKDIEKASKTTSDRVAKNADKMEQAYEDVEKQLKDLQKQTQKAFNNMNISGFTNAMNKVKSQVQSTMKQVQSTISKALNVSANIKVKATTDTSTSQQNKQGSSGVDTGALLAGGAMGASLQSNLAKTKESTYDVIKAMGGITDSYKEAIKEAMKFSRQSKALETAKTVYDEMAQSIRDAGHEIGGFDEAVEATFFELQDSIMKASVNSKQSIRDVTEALDNFIHTLSGNGLDNKLVRELIKTYEYLDRISSITRGSKNNRIVDGRSVESTNRQLAVLQGNLDRLKPTIDSIMRMSAEDKAKKALGDSVNRVKELGDAYLNAHPIVSKFYNTLNNNSTVNGLKKIGVNAKAYLGKAVEWFKKLRSEADNASKSVSKSSKNMNSSFKDLKNTLAKYFGMYEVFKYLKDSVTNAMESIETNNMFDTVFGDSANEMDAWVQKMNQTLGLGVTDTKKYTSTIMQMGKAMDMNTQHAMEMSQSFATMAGDMSSFYNVDLAQAQQDLQSALSGSNETLQKYGIILTEDKIKQDAYTYGIATMGAELTSAQRAMTLTMMVERQLGVANGDLARSITSPANQLRILRSNLYDLSVALGSCFMPILTVVLPILNRFVSALTSTINAVANFISQLFSLFGVSVGGSGGGGGSSSIGGGGGGGFLSDVADGVGSIGTALGDGLDSASGGAGAVADKLASGAESAKQMQKYLMGIDQINNIETDKDSGSSSPSGGGSGGSSSPSGGGGGGVGGGGGLGDLFGGLGDSAEDAKNKSKNELGEIADWIKDVANALKAIWGQLKAGWLSVADYINQSIANLKQAFINLGTSIKDFLIGAWNNGGDKLIYNFGRLAGAITGAVIDIFGQVVQAVANLFAYLNPDNNPYTRAFITGLNNLLVACQNFALSVGGWFRTFLDNGGQAFLNVMGDIFMILGAIFTQLLADAINAVTAFMNSWLGYTVISTVAIALDVIAGTIKALLLVIQKLLPLLEALAIAFAVLALAKIASDFTATWVAINSGLVPLASMTTLGGKLANKLGVLLANVTLTKASFIAFAKDGLKNFIKMSGQAFKAIQNLVKSLWTLGKDAIKSCINGVINLGKTIRHPIQSFNQMKVAIVANAKALGAWIKQTALGAWSAIKNLASACLSGIASMLGLATAEGTATATSIALGLALDAIGIGLIIAAIVGLVAVFKNWNTITAKVKETWERFMNFLQEKCPWLYNIFKAIGDVFSWVGEKVGWLWDKIKGFFGWESDNKIEEEVNATDESLNGLGDTIEETSERFGTACSAINESLSSIGIDSNKLALQLDEAEAMFNEKFNMISGSAREYLQAVTEGNEDMLSQMSGDADKYTAEIKSAFEDMSIQEQAVFYATYGEIQGVTDGWLDYTKGSYEECLFKHSAMLEQINNNENLTYDEKQRRIQEETEAFNTAQNEKLKQLNLTIAEMESAEWQSEEDKYQALQGYYEQRNQLVQDMENYQIGSIDTVDEAVKQSTQAQEDAYSETANAQQDALKEVDDALEDTKGSLSDFKKESDKVAKEIPKEWKGIGDTISKEFEDALKGIKTNFNGILSNTKKQCSQLKSGLQATFNDLKNGVKNSMVEINSTITTQFTKAVNQVKTVANGFKTTLQNIFKGISTGITQSLNTIKNSMTTSFKQIVTSITSSLNSCKSKVTSTLTSINSDVKTKTSTIQTTVKNQLKNISSSFTKPFTDARTSLGSSLTAINTVLASKLSVIVSTLQSYASQMKRTMNFNFPTPYLKMPHISVHGNWDFEKKTTPSFSVRWYSQGGIFPSRTLIGVGDANNGKGNNAEAVLPLDSLWKELNVQFQKQNQALKNNNQPIQVNLYLDGKVVTSTVIDNMKDQSKRGVLDTSWL